MTITRAQLCEAARLIGGMVLDAIDERLEAVQQRCVRYLTGLKSKGEME